MSSDTLAKDRNVAVSRSQTMTDSAEVSTHTDATFPQPAEQLPPSTPETSIHGIEEQILKISASMELNNLERTYLDEELIRKAQIHASLIDKVTSKPSYYSNTTKEDLILKYVENFNRQYQHLYPSRRDLILSPPNEFGTRKFICSSIRPTKLQFSQVYDYRACSNFVSELIAYKELPIAYDLPKIVHSPSYTLKMQTGNSFDMSILLASLLRGVGYDAYVVSGYATLSTTTIDQNSTESCLNPSASPSQLYVDDTYDLSTVVDNDSKLGKYKVKPEKKLASAYLNSQAIKLEVLESQRLEKEASDLRQKLAEIKSLDETDELRGMRVHAWVMVLPGRRDVSDMFFIESSTGKILDSENPHYLGIESVFSSLNYWVNMQICYQGVTGLSLDLSDAAKWEFVLLNNTQSGTTSTYETNNEDPDIVSDEEKEYSKYISMPVSWVERLDISQEQFESKCPSGSKKYVYKDAIHEVFAEYHRKDGMISRTSSSSSETKQILIKETYANRKDCLAERILIPSESKIHEYYSPGKQHGLKDHTLLDNVTSEMKFYACARSDGIVRRCDTKSKTILYFINRDDFLIYRSVTYDGEGDSESNIVKMTEKFSNPCLTNTGSIDKKTYFVREDKIRVVYHRGSGNIIPSVYEFKKQVGDQVPKGNLSDIAQIFQAHQLTKPVKKQDLYAQLLELTRSETVCFQEIKNSNREFSEIIQLRQLEEQDISLNISVYDTLRNAIHQQSLEDGSNEANKKNEDDAKGLKVDYLSPFLVNFVCNMLNQESSTLLSKDEAISVKTACLKGLKERLIDKAAIIQTQRDELTAEYQRRQQEYAKNAESMSPNETDSYVKFCNQTLFKVHILEKRLARQKEISPERYVELDGKLRADARLSAAF